MAKKEKSAAELYREERKKRLAKAAKKNSKKSITSQSAKIVGRIITVILILAIVGAVGYVIVRQTGVIERSKTAFTIDGENISEAEYGFYYMSNFNQYYQYAQYGYIQLDVSSSPSEQEYTGDLGEIEGFPEGETPTWADFFEYSARQQLKYIKTSVATAEKAGIALTDKDNKHIDSEIDEFAENAKKSNYSASAYLKANYGKGMNIKLYRKILSEQHLSTELQETKTEKYADALTNKEINEEYKNNMTTYGKISVISFNVPAASKTDEEGNTTSTKAALAVAQKEAAQISEADSEQDFRKLVNQVKKDDENAAASEITESTDSSYEDLQSICSDEGFLAWAADTKTQAGETYVFDDETSSTVFFMVEPIHKAADATVYDSRHILIKFVEDEETEDAEAVEEPEDSEEIVDEEDAEDAEIEEIDVSEDAAAEDAAEAETTTDAETTTEAETEKEESVEPLDLASYGELDFKVDNKVDGETAANKEAYKKIQDILAEYLKGDHTEDAFAALAEEYTEDEGSADNGGLYEDTEIGNFVPPYEEWCFEDGRKEGDVGIVEYQGDNYKGYHLIYFIGTGVKTWKDDVKDALASAKFNEFSEKLLKKAPEIENVNEKVCDEVVAFLDSILKRNAKAAATEQAAY